MQADVFTRFHVTLSDHVSAFVKGICLSLPDGVSGQRFNWDLSNRFREVFPLRYIYDPLNGLCKLQKGKENLAPEHRSGSTGEQLDLLILLNRVGGQNEEGKQRLLVLLAGVDGYLNDDLLVDELSRLFGGNQGETHEVTRRILAMLLTFLELPDSRNAYIVGTMNHLDVAPALFRRFDEAFYVGLPDEGRKEGAPPGPPQEIRDRTPG